MFGQAVLIGSIAALGGSLKGIFTGFALVFFARRSISGVEAKSE